MVWFFYEPFKVPNVGQPKNPSRTLFSKSVPSWLLLFLSFSAFRSVTNVKIEQKANFRFILYHALKEARISLIFYAPTLKRKGDKRSLVPAEK